MQFDLFNPPPKPASPPATNGEPKPKPRIRDASIKRAQMLERLQAGPLSTFDAERLHHRGQATIGALRGAGHIIDLVPIDGVPHYKYVAYDPQVKVTPGMQEAYYLTAHWREIARQRKEIDGFRCQECKTHQELQTHHWRYNLFQEDLHRDLITFCRLCHESVHAAASGSEMHFPRFVSEEIARRLMGVA